MTAVSFVVPLRNGRSCILATLEAIWAQAHERPTEVILVDDGSTDDGVRIAMAAAGPRPLRLLCGPGLGAAAAINCGMQAASHPIVCQVDQDVVIAPGWTAHLVAEVSRPGVGAAQGMYVTDERASVLARVMGRDLQERYARLGDVTNHVCTGNAAFRLDAVRAVGYFDVALGYGYDNDMSYRLRSAGYELVFCARATSVHRWREGWQGYLRQQYGFGYGRLDVVRKHPCRVGGDAVSPLMMMAHPVLLAMALLASAIGLVAASPQWLIASGLLLTLLVAERAAVGMRAAIRFRDTTPLLFPVVHLARDLAWVCAIGVWSARRLAGIMRNPAHSMHPRPIHEPSGKTAARGSQPLRPLAIIPAANEGASLPAVIRSLAALAPNLAVLVVDDGSTDRTAAIVRESGHRLICLPERMGIGTAMKVGLRYAIRNGFDVIVRLDGDGQHGPDEIVSLLEPINRSEADVVFGRRSHRDAYRGVGGVFKRLLSAYLTFWVGRAVTDPTCGFYALGPGALAWLSEHHPAGYPEPELRLLLSRTDLRSVEVAVRTQPRLHGKSTLTPPRMVAAVCRVALAMCIVPIRSQARRSV